MTLPSPFLYPSSVHSRRHGPAGYQDYESFKEWLRDEFLFRCVYCLFRERWYPNGSMSFSIDHVIPRSADRGGSSERDYGNLVYACNRCNSVRAVADVLNPTQCALAEHLEVREEDGSVMGRTDEGRRSIRILRLNDPVLRDHRRRVLVLLDLKRRSPDDPAIHNLFVRVFGYPEDLPDLRRLKPPLGNTRPGSEEGCHYALKERGELAEVY
jgi:HNH endonuclease